MCTAILEQSKVYGIYLGLDELFRILWVMEVCTTRKTGSSATYMVLHQVHA